MQKTDKIWRNGSFVSWDDAQVHVLTHALHYGTGVFEGIRAYETPKGAAVFRLTDHLERLRRSAALYEMDLGYSVSELAAVITRPWRSTRCRPATCGRSCSAATARWVSTLARTLSTSWSPCGRGAPTWVRTPSSTGVRCKVSSFRRIGPNTLPPAAKASGQYINSVLAKLEASAAATTRRSSSTSTARSPTARERTCSWCATACCTRRRPPIRASGHHPVEA